MRLLFVHAHPDDESLWTGVSLAHHVAAGDDVHVLTLTLGEEGEVIPPELAHLELPAGQERDPQASDPLAAVRRAELAEAMTRMGVASSVVLGEDGSGPTYRDSGMAGTPSARHPRALTGAPVDQVSAQVREHVVRVGADVVVTYDENGGYGHPDHVRTHEVTVAAVRAMAAPPRLMVVLTPQSWYAEDQDWLRTHLDESTRDAHRLLLPPDDHTARLSVVPDDLVTHATVDPGVLPVQRAAVEAHRTQVRLAPGCLALSNDVAVRTAGREGFAQLDVDTGRTVREAPGLRRGLQED